MKNLLKGDFTALKSERKWVTDITALGVFYRRLSARIGKAKAVTATARNIAILFYNAMRFGMVYQDPVADHYEQKYRERVVKGM